MYLEGKLEINETIIRYVIIKEFSCTEDGHCDINIRGFETKSDMSKYFNLLDMEDELTKKQFAMDRVNLKIQEIEKEIAQLKSITNKNVSSNISVLNEDLNTLKADSVFEEYDLLKLECEKYDKDYCRFNESYFPVIEKDSDTDVNRELMYNALINYVEEFKNFQIIGDKVITNTIVLEELPEEIISKEGDEDAS